MEIQSGCSERRESCFSIDWRPLAQGCIGFAVQILSAVQATFSSVAKIAIDATDSNKPTSILIIEMSLCLSYRLDNQIIIVISDLSYQGIAICCGWQIASRWLTIFCERKTGSVRFSLLRRDPHCYHRTKHRLIVCIDHINSHWQLSGLSKFGYRIQLGDGA